MLSFIKNIQIHNSTKPVPVTYWIKPQCAPYMGSCCRYLASILWL